MYLELAMDQNGRGGVWGFVTIDLGKMLPFLINFTSSNFSERNLATWLPIWPGDWFDFLVSANQIGCFHLDFSKFRDRFDFVFHRRFTW